MIKWLLNSHADEDTSPGVSLLGQPLCDSHMPKVMNSPRCGPVKVQQAQVILDPLYLILVSLFVVWWRWSFWRIDMDMCTCRPTECCLSCCGLIERCIWAKSCGSSSPTLLSALYNDYNNSNLLLLDHHNLAFVGSRWSGSCSSSSPDRGGSNLLVEAILLNCPETRGFVLPVTTVALSCRYLKKDMCIQDTSKSLGWSHFLLLLPSKQKILKIQVFLTDI